MTIKKHILVIVLLFLGAFFVGVGALVVVQTIPSASLKQQSATALAVFEKAGIQRPALARDINATRVDYYADAHMYQLSFGVPGSTNMTNALFPMSFFPGNQPDEMNNVQEVAGLKARLQGTPVDADNGRYWNGFIIPMKLFGSLFSYNTFRILNGVLLAALFLAVTIVITRMLGWQIAVCFVLSLALMWVWVVPFCLEYLSVFYLMGVGIIAVLLLAKKGKLVKWGPELFLLLGILTAYLDLLTAPLVTLGFPLIIAALCLLRSNHRSEFAYLFKHLLVWILLWLLGFAGFWAAKIVLTQAMFGYGVLSDAMSRLGGYTSPEGARPLLTQIFGLALPANLGTFIGRSGQDVLKHYSSAWVRSAIAAVILCVPPAAVAAWTRLRKLPVGASAILLLVATLPFLRMMVTSIHSDWNSFFTFREFGVAYFAVFTFCVFQLAALRKTRAAGDADAS